tara:strand:+ start:235 stop:1521 length:1287 start_codon:yes stop_codon:yes gene_type:complete
MDKSLSIINAKIEATLSKVDCIGFTDEARDASQRARAMLGWPGLSQTWSRGSKNSSKQPWQKKNPKDWTQKEAKNAVDQLKKMQENGDTDSQEYEDLIIACDTFVSGDRSNDSSTYQETNIMENAIEEADIPGIDGNTYVPPGTGADDEEFDELKFRTGDTEYGEDGVNMNDGDEDFENEERDSMDEADRMAEGRRQAAEEQRQRENEQMGLDADAEDFQFEDDEEGAANARAAMDEFNRQKEGINPTGDADPDFQQQERDSMAETNTETNENQAEESGSGDSDPDFQADEQFNMNDAIDRAFGPVDEESGSGDANEDFQQQEQDSMNQSDNRSNQSEANEQADFDASQAASQDISDLGDADQGSSNSDPQREKFNKDLADTLDAIDQAPNSAELRDSLRDKLNGVDNYVDPRTGNEIKESDGWADDE